LNLKRKGRLGPVVKTDNRFLAILGRVLGLVMHDEAAAKVSEIFEKNVVKQKH